MNTLFRCDYCYRCFK